MVQQTRKGVLDYIFGSGTTDKVNNFIDDAYNKAKDFIDDIFPKITVENETYNSVVEEFDEIKENFWEDLWEKIAFQGSKKSSTSSNAKERGNQARNYIIGFTSPKSFTSWLSELGLSSDENSDKYFGNYFKDAADALLKSAYSDKEYNIAAAKKERFENNLSAGNAYKISQSDFNSKAQTLYKKGLKNSGFDSYLKGIAYLGYRNEIAANNRNYEESVNEYNKAYADKKSEIEADRNQKIADRESELLKLYKDEEEFNKGLIRSLT